MDYESSIEEMRAELESNLANLKTETVSELEEFKREFEDDEVNWRSSCTIVERLNRLTNPHHNCDCKAVHAAIRDADRAALDDMCNRVMEAFKAMEVDMRKNHDEIVKKIRALDPNSNDTLIVIDKEFRVGNYYVPKI